MLKIDDRPVKLWELYRAEKKDSLLLLQLGSRFLLLDLDTREIFELPENSLTRVEKNLRLRSAEHSGKRLASSDWYFRDLGRARLVRARLSDEGRVLEIQLPQTPRHRNFY